MYLLQFLCKVAFTEKEKTTQENKTKQKARKLGLSDKQCFFLEYLMPSNYH